MISRISLGLCNDRNISRLANLCKKGKIVPGDSVALKNGKTYIVYTNQVFTYANKKDLGEVRKSYKLLDNGEWHLSYRSVNNSRGLYRRGVNVTDGVVEDSVSLGGQQTFVRMADGKYIQHEFLGYPENIVTSEEVEAAIDYIKGKGWIGDYTKLLRDFRIQ